MIKKLAFLAPALFIYAGTMIKTPIAYITSNAPTTHYCNGATMDADGYQKTIQHPVITHQSTRGLSPQALINATLKNATGMPNLITLQDHTALVRPINGWAGISIFLCHFKPMVETNLRRFSVVHRVVWAR